MEPVVPDHVDAIELLLPPPVRVGRAQDAAAVVELLPSRARTWSDRSSAGMFQNPYWPFFGRTAAGRRAARSSNLNPPVERARQPRRHVEARRASPISPSPHTTSAPASEVELQHRVSRRAARRGKRVIVDEIRLDEVGMAMSLPYL